MRRPGPVLRFYFLLFLLAGFYHGNTQQSSIEKQKQAILAARSDTSKTRLVRLLAISLITRDQDTTMLLCRQGLVMARANHMTGEVIEFLALMAGVQSYYPEKKDSAWLLIRQAFVLARDSALPERELSCYQVISSIYYFNWEPRDSAFIYAQEGIDLAEKHQLVYRQIVLMKVLGFEYANAKMYDDCSKVLMKCYELAKKNKFDADAKSAMDNLYFYASRAPIDTTRRIIIEASSLLKKMNDRATEASYLYATGLRLRTASHFPEALKFLLEAMGVYRELDDKKGVAATLSSIGQLYRSQGDYEKSMDYFSQCIELQEKIDDSTRMFTYEMIGSIYAKFNNPDSAIYFANKAIKEAERVGEGYVSGGVLNDVGEIYAQLGKDSIAMDYFRRSLPDILANGPDKVNLCVIYVGMAKLFKKAGKNDSAYHYAQLAAPIAKEFSIEYAVDTYSLIADYFKEKRMMDSAYYYKELSVAAKDTLFNAEKVKELQNIQFSEQMRIQQLREAETRIRNRINSFALIAGLIIVLVIAGLLFRGYRLKQKALSLLQIQKREIDIQKEKVEKTLEDLKSTQAQLIQSEKMASLGELTAGIAHEIQNPLNFVNNFSEINSELISELNEAIAKENWKEAAEIAIDIKKNEEKIAQHGNRADGIVKAMLQHSRSSSGVKELTDINSLADEYLRLSYHGFRAKDKSFNVKLSTEFDPNLQAINIIPQDIGRVLLNLYNNAFYAVGQKLKSGANFEPSVSVSTVRKNGQCEISVNDNGNGIPAHIQEKIFQPFFTTKPTGEGTGLGLSLSYDIIKSLGGDIRVASSVSNGTSFIVALPT